nr:unnamed protein product [Digitaria exilis]
MNSSSLQVPLMGQTITLLGPMDGSQPIKTDVQTHCSLPPKSERKGESNITRGFCFSQPRHLVESSPLTHRRRRSPFAAALAGRSAGAFDNRAGPAGLPE